MDDELSKRNCKQLIVFCLNHFDTLSNEINQLNRLDICIICVLLGLLINIHHMEPKIIKSKEFFEVDLTCEFFRTMMHAWHPVDWSKEEKKNFIFISINMMVPVFRRKREWTNLNGNAVPRWSVTQVRVYSDDPGQCPKIRLKEPSPVGRRRLSNRREQILHFDLSREAAKR